MRKILGTGIKRSMIMLVTLSISFWLISPSTSAGAVTALMMGGTSQPHADQVPGYMETTARRYLDPVSACKIDTCLRQSVYIPNEASPIWTDGMAFGPSVAVGTGLLDIAVRAALAQADEQIVVFGNSQSATVATEVKRALGADPTIDTSRLSFVLIGNPNRPNGGFMQRFFPAKVPVLEYLPHGEPVNDTGMTTTDIAFHYDIAADFPRYPLNLLAVLNVFAGMAVHGAYDDKVNPNGYTEAELQAEINNPLNRVVIGDTTYVTIPTKVLPLAEALRGIGHTNGLSAVMTPLADFLEPVLRVLVELGYDRTLPAGVQRSFGLLPAINPIKVTQDIVSALGQGFHKMVTNLIARQQGAPQQQSAVPFAAAAARELPPATEPEPLSQKRSTADESAAQLSSRKDIGAGESDIPQGNGPLDDDVLDDNSDDLSGDSGSDDDEAPEVPSDNDTEVGESGGPDEDEADVDADSEDEATDNDAGDDESSNSEAAPAGE